MNTIDHTQKAGLEESSEAKVEMRWFIRLSTAASFLVIPLILASLYFDSPLAEKNKFLPKPAANRYAGIIFHIEDYIQAEENDFSSYIIFERAKPSPTPRLFYPIKPPANWGMLRGDFGYIGHNIDQVFPYGRAICVLPVL